MRIKIILQQPDEKLFQNHLRHRQQPAQWTKKKKNNIGGPSFSDKCCLLMNKLLLAIERGKTKLVTRSPQQKDEYNTQQDVFSKVDCDDWLVVFDDVLDS